MTEITEHIQQAFQALHAAGLFDMREGKATVHFKDGLVQGVQVEAWAYRRQAKLSTPPSLPKHIPL